MRKILAATLFFITAVAASGQNFYGKYGWDESLQYKDLIKEIGDTTLPSVHILDERAIEYNFDRKNEFFEYVFFHQQLYLNSAEAVNGNNKVYIPMDLDDSLLLHNARVLSPAGVKRLSEKDLITGTDEDGRKIVYYALSGVELGSVVEYYFLMRREPVVTGNIQKFQSSAPLANARFSIYSPDFLVFRTKSFNGLPDMINDTTVTGYNLLTVTHRNIPALADELFANPYGNQPQVLYQLHENRNAGKKNLYNYADISQLFFERLSAPVGKGIQKELEKLLKETAWKFARDDRDRIFRIEDYVKRRISFVDAGDPRLSDIDFILKNKAANDFGLSRLLYHLYKMAGIEFELVLTANRSKMRFDKEFESYAYLDEYALYFPAVDDYVSTHPDYRLGLIPAGFITNNGLFIKGVGLGDVEVGAGEVRYIKPYPAEHTRHNTDVYVSFGEGMEDISANVTNSWTGYYAQNFQPVYTYLEPDKVEEFNKSIVHSMYPDVEAEAIQVLNKGVENLMQFPFTLKCTIKTNKYLERAGQNVLFKVGELIGPQVEMYQKGERQLPVENDFNRIYNREIIFTIPDGYTCKNLDKLNLNVLPFAGQADAAGFKAAYTQEGNKVTVKITEYYNEIFLPKDKFESYRQVINAAADFNKVVLLFEKM